MEIFLPKVRQVQGSVGIIKTYKGELVMLLEKEDRPWKTAGQWSFLMESLKDNESGEEALKRGFQEEFGFPFPKKSRISLNDDRKKLLCYDTNSSTYFLLKAYLFEVFLSDKDLKQIFSYFKPTSEVEKVKLFSLSDIIYGKINVRPGVKEILTGAYVDKVIKNGKYSLTTMYW